MAKLNQLIAVEKGVKDEQNREITDAYHLIKKADAHTGLARRYTPIDAEGETLPTESRKVQVKVDETMKQVSDKWARLMDVVTSKDYTNTKAMANIVVDGTVIAKDVPVTTLLWLEKQLNDLSTFVGSLPTLDVSREWHWDSAAAVFASEPEETKRAKKVMKNHEISPATKEHPAQVQVYTEDVPVGTWTSTHFSGAIEESKKIALKEKVSQLQKAVKFAREEANSIDAVDKPIGRDIFDWLLS